MSFRDYITNRHYRKALGRSLRRDQTVQVPKHPSSRYIRKRVGRLLVEGKTDLAYRELVAIGKAALPQLVAVMRDPRYHRPDWGRMGAAGPAPLGALLGLLLKLDTDHAFVFAQSLAADSSEKVRKQVAIQISALGQPRVVPLIESFLQDEDGYVRSYTVMGIETSIREARAEERFRQEIYPLLLQQCNQKWQTTSNDSPQALVSLDPLRAAQDLAQETYLSIENPIVARVLEACNRAEIALPVGRVEQVLEQALSRAVGEQCYPHDYTAGAALDALALSAGAAGRSRMEAAIRHEHQQVREGAAKGLLRLAGLTDPVERVLTRINEVGFDQLTSDERVVYCCFIFDAQVRNGGLMQFFGNRSGALAVETLESLAVIGHELAHRALAQAMEQVGPSVKLANQDLRLAGFEGRYDRLEQTFSPLEGAYYKENRTMREKIIAFAIRHPDSFRDGDVS